MNGAEGSEGTAAVDVFVPRGGRTPSEFDAWISKAARDASPRDAAQGDGSQQAVAQRAEWPPTPTPFDATAPPRPLDHPLLEVAAGLRQALAEYDATAGGAAADGDPADRGGHGFPAESPLVLFARGAALLDRALAGAQRLGERAGSRDREQLVRTRDDARAAFRALKAASDLANEVRVAAFSLDKLT